MLPLFLILFIRTLVGSDAFPISPYNEIGFGLAVIGFLVSLFTMKFKKEDDL